MLVETLKTGFVENKGQSGPLSVVSKTQGKCQLSVNFRLFVSCQLEFWLFVSRQLTPSRPSLKGSSSSFGGG